MIGFHGRFGIGGQTLAVLGTVLALIPAAAQQPDTLTPAASREHARRMAQGIELFKREVRPLLGEKCLPCHGGAQTLGGFDLADRDSLINSGKIDPSPAGSRFLALIRHQQEPHMPFRQPKLPDEAIASIARRLDLGAPYDSPLVDRPGEGPLEVSNEHRRFWSFRPPVPHFSMCAKCTGAKRTVPNFSPA